MVVFVVVVIVFCPCCIVAAECHVSADSVHVMGFCDFNTPGARQAAKSDSLCQGISLCCDMGIAKQNACMVLMPDHPRDSSLRGLWDEEKQIIENLFAHRQQVECRFVDLFTREPRSENKTSMRRWAAGRLVVNSESAGENVWLNSELAICGRPVGRQEGEQGAPCSVLPRSSSLPLPEGASPESDLKIADRTRPSREQTSAQKRHSSPRAPR